MELIAPGLLGPVPVLPEQLPPTPVLDRLLGRAETLPSPAATPEALLLARFGLPPDAGTAAYALHADDPDADQTGWWLHADPVHLRADLDRLRLFDGRRLDIEPAEAAALADAFNAHFADDGLRLHAPVAERWYLQAQTPPRITAQPLSVVAGRSVDPFLPVGDDARRWAGLMNEAQMLFHQHPVNQRREQTGRPAINGLWTWGGGRWAPIPRPAELSAVHADLALARGLAEAAGIATLPGSSVADHIDDPGTRLWVYNDLQPAVIDAEPAPWCRALAELDALLAPALAALRAGRLAELVIDADARYRIRRRDLGRFWRRSRPLSARLGVAPRP